MGKKRGNTGLFKKMGGKQMKGSSKVQNGE